MVLIGIDPHKATHTAVAVDTDETALDELTVKADRHQVERLLKWAIDFPDRRWAVESANGLGFLLAQQLVAAGEDVVDVPPTLAARVRVLGSGKTQKNDPNDALSTAIAALRAKRLRAVGPRTTGPSCACSPTTTAIWGRCAPRPSVGSMPCCGASSQVGRGFGYQRTAPPRCCAACDRRPRCKPSVSDWPLPLWPT